MSSSVCSIDVGVREKNITDRCRSELQIGWLFRSLVLIIRLLQSCLQLADFFAPAVVSRVDSKTAVRL